MSPRRRFAVVLAALSALVLGGVGLLGVGLWASAEPRDRTSFGRVLSGQVALLVIAGLLLVFGLGLGVWWFVDRYVTPARRLAGETRIVASANPDHRLDPGGPAEMFQLALAVNELADRYRAARSDVQGQISAARTNVEQERNRLAALMSQLTLAVLVCNAEGRILLYNAAARQLFDSGGRVGLGRSVFGIVEESLVGHALERIRAGSAAFHEAMTARDGRLLRVQVASVAAGGDEPAGFVLTLEDMTRRAEGGLRRSALLRALTEQTRASVGNVRAAVESMLDYPEMEPVQRQQFVEIIREEALGLSDRMERTLRESAGWREEQWSRAEILGQDLTGVLERSLQREHGLRATTDAPASELWLEVDSYAIVLAVTQLAGRLRAARGVEDVMLALRPAGRWGQLDLRWTGAPLAAEMLRAWTTEPLGPAAGASTVKEVVERHGGEVWSKGDEDGRSAYLRLLLPLPEAVPTAPARPAADSWPEYDFDLFRRTEQTSAWDDRRLDELAYTVFDTETTGLDPGEGDEIIAIGAVRIVNGRLLRQETLERLVDPGRRVSPAAVKIHGISGDLLKGQPAIGRVLPEFARFAEDTVLVGHNVAFDMQFLKLKEASTGVRFSQPVLDTLLLSAAVHPDQDNHSLEAIAERLGISVVGRHTALGDAVVTGEIFLRLLRLLAARDLVTLADAREAARRTYQARVSDSLYAER